MCEKGQHLAGKGTKHWEQLWSQTLQETIVFKKPAKVQLLMLPFLPHDAEDETMLDAADDNNFELLEELLRKRLNPNVQDKEGCTSLHCAANAGYVDVMRLLIEAGAGKNALTYSPQDWTPLMAAAQSQKPEAVQLVIEAIADANMARTYDEHDAGPTALWFAAARGHLEVARLLIEARADTNRACADAGDSTPLRRAAGKGHIEIY